MGRDLAIQRLRRAFMLGLGFLALVVIAAQVIAARVPADSVTYVHIVNLASRQRMLCQRITKTAFMIHDGSTVSEGRAREELDSALGEFARTHHALRHGDPELGLPGKNSTTVKTRFEDIDRWFRDVASAGEALLAEAEASSNARQLLMILLEAERQFLPRMEAIVSAYEQETASRMKRFRDLETLILTVTFFSLVGIALGVIRPVIRNVETEMERRLEAEAKLRKQAEELRDTASAAEAAMRAKARFLASMSHEMRTPLNGVVGMAQVMEESDLDGEQRASLEVIQDSSQTLLALISDVLDLAKIEADRLDLEYVDFDLHDLVSQTLRIVGTSAPDKDLDIAIEILPGTPRRVIGDPTRIRQILLNLLSNAVKFTADGSVVLRVAPREGTRPDRKVVRFEVTDTGIGIGPQQKLRLFQPFTQGDESTTRRFGGTGLGLAISKHLVNCMGGSLAFDSELGMGSTFHFELEFEMGHQTELPTESPDVSIIGETPPLSILVVDDLKLNRLVARKLLELLGHQIDEAEDGLEAVAAVQNGVYDVVLMDMEMPRLDGLGATARIRELEGDGAHTPVIALTANALAGDRERILAAGIDGYLSKPIERRQLIEVLASVNAGRMVPSGANS